jgi:hypothetical protein
MPTNSARIRRASPIRNGRSSAEVQKMWEHGWGFVRVSGPLVELRSLLDPSVSSVLRQRADQQHESNYRKSPVG